MESREKMKPSMMVTSVIFLGVLIVNISGASAETLFPTGLPARQWQQFQAAGYSQPVTGIIYRGDPRPVSGMPLGGIDTGCLDLETAGTFGYSSIFNHLTPRGGPVNLPFLGISVNGKTWVLTTGQTKLYDESLEPVPLGPVMVLKDVMKAEAIDYWGHFPIADLQFQTDAPVSVGLRAWSPFLPGHEKRSTTPGAVFEVHLRNTSDQRKAGALAFSFPGFDSHESGLNPVVFRAQAGYARRLYHLPERKVVRRTLKGELPGVAVSDENWKMSYVLAAIGEKNFRLGGGLGADGQKWSAIGQRLPKVILDNGGSSLAVDFRLDPGQEKVTRFILAWHAPEWKGNGAPDSGGNTYQHMYAARYPDAVAVAKYLAKNHDKLLQRIIAWQEEVYATPEIPGWLADSLINNLHVITRVGIWAQAKLPIGDWCNPQDGLFALNECPRGCSQMDCSPPSACGNLPLVYFFPQTELSTLRAKKAYQFQDGRPPWVFGGCTGDQGDGGDPSEYYELVYPSRGYQAVMNGSNYLTRLDRWWRISGDDDFLKEFYQSAKKATKWAFNLRPNYGLSQIVAMPTPILDYKKGIPHDTEWFEDQPYYGYVTHAGGYRMVHARMMRSWAEKMGDTEFVGKMDAYLQAGAEALEKYLWAGTHYLVSNEPETGRSQDALFTPIFTGQFLAHQHGLPGVFPQDRVDTVLGMIRKSCSVSKLGIPPNYLNPKGDLWESEDTGYLTGNYTYVTFTTYNIAMMFMYEGQKEFGMDLLYKCLEPYACKWGYTWESVNVLSGKGDTGERTYGTDYNQNMSLWGAPAAILFQDMIGPCQPDGLVNRMIRAAKM